ncbi:hypothetical protein [Vreelandella stevensii]|uniref:hypothetical protein n=1 Tax=Vreelandella stevensii TaxID=502821 RepID=UPI003749DC65
MGKARILEAWGEGRYTIEIIESRERAEFAKQQAQERVTRLEGEIATLDNQIYQSQLAVDSAAAEQNAAIEQYRQDMAASGESDVQLPALSEALIRAAGRRDALRNERRAKEIMVASDEALIARVNQLPALRQIQAWCADYTEDLEGEVATAEVPGEIGAVIIKPGFDGGEDSPLQGNQWAAEVDGAIQPALSGTPAGVFYNLAMLPGWQKWRPTYRVATITALDGDTCTIVLEHATSSQQRLPVNERNQYEDVPILYMDCNGAAFEEGDRVLVAFAGNVEGPAVVGFESEPKSCGMGFDMQPYANWRGFFISFRNGLQLVDANEDPGSTENWNPPPTEAIQNWSPGTLAYYFRSTKEMLAHTIRASAMSATERFVIAIYECDDERVPIELVCQFEKTTNVRHVTAEFNEPVVFRPDVTYMVASISTYRYFLPGDEKTACLPHPHIFKDKFEQENPHINLILPGNGRVWGYSDMWRRSAVDRLIGELPDRYYMAQIVPDNTNLPPGVSDIFDVTNIIPLAINPTSDPVDYVTY